MHDKAKHIACLAEQCRPLQSSSKTQTCCLVDGLTQLLIDACCTELNALTTEVLDRSPPNLYEMYTSTAALVKIYSVVP